MGTHKWIRLSNIDAREAVQGRSVVALPRARARMCVCVCVCMTPTCLPLPTAVPKYLRLDPDGSIPYSWGPELSYAHSRMDEPKGLHTHTHTHTPLGKHA